MRSLLALSALMMGACVVEDVVVDTGGRDTGTERDEAPLDRPDPLGGDDPEEPFGTGDSGAAPAGQELVMEPASVPRGGTTLVFLDGGQRPLDDVVDVALYGEPDATLGTWSSDGPQRLVLVVDVEPSSPAGELLVVLEHEGGAISRPEAPLVVY